MSMNPVVDPSPTPTQKDLDPFVAMVVKRAIGTGAYVGKGAFLAQALNAATLEEATNIGEVISGKEHRNERIRFMDVQFLESDPELDSTIPLFALATVVREMGDGVEEKLSCGADHVLGTLIAAKEKGWFPFDAEIVGVDLGPGRQALNLRLAPRKVDTLEEL